MSTPGQPAIPPLSSSSTPPTALSPWNSARGSPHPDPHAGGYWSFDSELATHEDIAWAYDFPTVHADRIAGMVAFYNEYVDLIVDGTSLPRSSPPRH